MAKQKNNTGLIVGRFQILHLGHQQMIQEALNRCDRVLLFIGSSQESRTEKNPFTYEERRGFIETVFSEEVKHNRLIIASLPDRRIGDSSSWGDYVMQEAWDILGYYPEMFISGEENRRSSWFDNYGIREIYITKIIPVSASMVRQFVIEGNRDGWNDSVPEELKDKFEFVREIVEKSKVSERVG